MNLLNTKKFCSAITVSAADYGWLAFKSYEKDSSSLFKRQLHDLVRQIKLIVVGNSDKVNFSNRSVFIACSLGTASYVYSFLRKTFSVLLATLFHMHHD